MIESEAAKLKVAKRSAAMDVVGDSLDYARCGCGKSWFYAFGNNPGIYCGGGSGKTLCNECYIRDKEAIDKANDALMSQEVWVYDTTPSSPPWAIDAGCD